MLEEMIERLRSLAKTDRSARAYMQLIAGLQMAKANKETILLELAQMDYFNLLIRTQLNEY